VKRITVDLEDQIYEQFRVATVVDRTTMTKVLREAVETYLAERGKGDAQ
jgi:hypothetical protein